MAAPEEVSTASTTTPLASPDALSMGMRVKPRWRNERRGHVTDLECFVPE